MGESRRLRWAPRSTSSPPMLEQRHDRPPHELWARRSASPPNELHRGVRSRMGGASLSLDRVESDGGAETQTRSTARTMTQELNLAKGDCDGYEKVFCRRDQTRGPVRGAAGGKDRQHLRAREARLPRARIRKRRSALLLEQPSTCLEQGMGLRQ